MQPSRRHTEDAPDPVRRRTLDLDAGRSWELAAREPDPPVNIQPTWRPAFLPAVGILVGKGVPQAD